MVVRLPAFASLVLLSVFELLRVVCFLQVMVVIRGVSGITVPGLRGNEGPTGSTESSALRRISSSARMLG